MQVSWGVISPPCEVSFAHSGLAQLSDSRSRGATQFA